MAHELAGLLPPMLPSPREIGYYAPTQGLVLFYGSPGWWPGLVRMGGFSYGLDELRALPDGMPVHISARIQR